MSYEDAPPDVWARNHDPDGKPRMATEQEKSSVYVDVEGRLILWHGYRVLLGSHMCDW